MALGALIDAGADLDEVRALCDRLPLGGWEVEAEPVRALDVLAVIPYIGDGGIQDRPEVEPGQGVAEPLEEEVLPSVLVVAGGLERDAEGGVEGHGDHLADGGVVDWTQQLLSNAKERLVISGIGSDRVCKLKADP